VAGDTRAAPSDVIEPSVSPRTGSLDPVRCRGAASQCSFPCGRRRENAGSLGNQPDAVRWSIGLCDEPGFRAMQVSCRRARMPAARRKQDGTDELYGDAAGDDFISGAFAAPVQTAESHLCVRYRRFSSSTCSRG